jgi:endo-1,4-beta-xylanase
LCQVFEKKLMQFYSRHNCKKYYLNTDSQKNYYLIFLTFKTPINMKKVKLFGGGLVKGVLSCSAVCLLMLTSCKKDEVLNEAAPAKSSSKDRHARGPGTGDDGGKFWTLYHAGSGWADISFPNGGGNFAISYGNVGDAVGGKGWRTGAARTVNYNVGALSGSRDFVGVYGWTRFPLIEYYVVESGYISPQGGPSVNNISSDGHNYNFVKHQQVNQPSIESTRSTFWQYIDNWGGQQFNGNKSINMANHFNNWRARGGQGFGSTYGYQVFGVEAYNGKTGYINATVW